MKTCFYSFLFAFAVIISGCSSDVDVPVTGGQLPAEDMEAQDLVDAPDFTLKTLADIDISLSDYKDKVLVIFFFGHNCPPCLAVGPSIESDLNQEFNSKADFALIGIDVWNGNNAEVEKYLKTTSVSYPLALKGGSVGSSYKSGKDRLVVVNKESKIVFNGTSAAKNDLKEVQQIVRDLTD